MATERPGGHRNHVPQQIEPYTAHHNDVRVVGAEPAGEFAQATQRVPLALGASTLNTHGETLSRPRISGAVGRRRAQRTLHRSISGPPFAALPGHYSLYGQTTYRKMFREPAFEEHPEDTPTYKALSTAAAAAEAEAEASAVSEAAADEHGTSQLPWPPPQRSLKPDKLLATTRFPPVGKTTRPAYRRTASESKVRRARKLPLSGEPAHREVERTVPFPRPYRVGPDGEEIRLPSRTEMIRKILGEFPSPSIQNDRSLYHYSPSHHAPRGLRDTSTAYDGLQARWR